MLHRRTDTWLGLLLGTQRRDASPSAVYGAVRAEALAAVESGFTVLVAPEHLHAEPYAMLQPWPLLAALREAAGDEVAAVGSVIAPLTTPTRLEAELATLRGIGAGPVGAGLAAGYRPEDFAAGEREFDQRFARRAAILRELAERGACDEGWLWCAAGSERAARRAAAAGVPWYGPPTMPVAEAARIAEATGAPCVLRRDILLGADADDVAARWARYVEPKYGALAAWGFEGVTGAAGRGGAGLTGADSAGPGRLAGPAAQVLAGTPDEVAAGLDALIAEVRPVGLVLRLCWPDMDADAGVAHVRAFADSVVGAVA